MAHAPRRLTGSTTPPSPRRSASRRALVVGTAAAALCALATAGLPALAASAATAVYTPGTQLVSDSFARTTTGGWGAATVGGAYTVDHASAFSTAPGAGTMSLQTPGGSLTAGLASVSAADVATAATIDIPKIPTAGSGVYAGLELRSAAGSYYRANVRVGSSDTLTLTIVRVNGTTQTTVGAETAVVTGLKAGSAVQLQFQATGSDPVHLQARAWLAGAAQPGWQVTADDTSAQRLDAAGDIAAWSYLSSASAAQTVQFDALSASSLVVAPVVPAASPAPAGDPSINTTGARSSAGAQTVGTTAYPVPANAIVVSPTGSDSAAGTLMAPFATVQKAIDVAPNGGTIVLRQGSYHESLTTPGGKVLTIQSYPNEAVYLDGSTVVSTWVQSGSVWKATGWNHVFDDSPTFTRGAPDGTTSGWQWINPAYPMAAHPDQLWVGGTAMQQVASAAQVVPGTFFYDTAAQTLILGSNPTGKEVRASDLQKAITVGSAGFTLKGIGVRRYAPSVPDMGAVTDYQGGATFENDTFTDMATTGISLGGAGNTLRHVTASRDGLLGVQANYSDNLTLDGVLATDDNAEHFNTSPVSGGVKITRSRNITVENSAFLHNQSHGIWFDESVYNMTIVHNDALGNVGNGIVLEISSTANIADNVASQNGMDGLKLDDISSAQVWNNTLADNTGRNLDITQDARRGNNPADAGHDPRQPFPDPTMTWITGPDTIRNNIISGGSGNCLLCVEDYSHTFSAAQLGIAPDDNLYRRPSATAPTWFAVWSRGVGNPAVYDTLTAFTAATGEDAHSTLVENAPAETPAQLDASAPGTATGLPAAIATLEGKPIGTAHLGAW